MLFHHMKLDQHVAEMKNMAVRLAKYPNDDEDLCLFKQREIIVDGYFIIVYFARYDYEQDGYLDVISISGKYMSFLPIVVLCKVAEKFLGNKELSFFDFLKDGRRFYSWTVYHKKDGTPIPNQFIQNGGKQTSYNGLEFISCDQEIIM